MVTSLISIQPRPTYQEDFKAIWILNPIPTLIIKDETLYHEIQKKKNNFIQISQQQRGIRWTQVPLRNTMELIHLHVLPIYAMEDTSYSSVIRMIIRKN